MLLLQELQGESDGRWEENVFLHRFPAYQKIADAWGKKAFLFCFCLFLASYSTSNMFLLVSGHTNSGPSKNPLKFAL